MKALDSVDSAEALIYAVARHAGAGSETMREVKSLLLAGHEPKAIAEALAKSIKTQAAK